MSSQKPDKPNHLRSVHLKVVTEPEPLLTHDLQMSHAAGEVTSRTHDQIVEFLAYHRAYGVYWINRSDEISLSELHRSGVNLMKLTFVTAKNAFLSLKNCLQAGRHPLLIAPKNELSETDLAALRPLLGASHAELILTD